MEARPDVLEFEGHWLDFPLTHHTEVSQAVHGPPAPQSVTALECLASRKAQREATVVSRESEVADTIG